MRIGKQLVMASVLAVGMIVGGGMAKPSDAALVTQLEFTGGAVNWNGKQERVVERSFNREGTIKLGEYQSWGEIGGSFRKDGAKYSLLTSNILGASAPTASIDGNSISLDLSSLFLAQKQGGEIRLWNIGGKATGLYNPETSEFSLSWKHLFKDLNDDRGSRYGQKKWGDNDGGDRKAGWGGDRGGYNNRASFFLEGTVVNDAPAPVAIPAAVYMYSTGLLGIGLAWLKRRPQMLTAMKGMFTSVRGGAVAMALGAIVLMAGMVGEAQAIQFGSGDLVLAVYGNETELVQKVGTIGSLPNAGISTSIDLSGVAGPNPLQYTLFGFTQTPPSAPTSFVAGSSLVAGSFTAAQKIGIAPTNFVNPLFSWGTQLAAINDTRTLIPKADQFSFTSFLNLSGNNSMNGGFPVRTSSEVDTLLNLIGRQNSGQGNVAVTDLGTAMLTSAGLLTIPGASAPPVPVPAAAVLFATGIIGLAGIARRSWGNGQMCSA
ncbi:hypothetical protein W02_20480 [Nitrospira sp. KM1]|uniref:hypothetical protein n=1 Tax=Nitrospira sp. KM1 TaxID=1936990 RepID=UPI0013A75F65|nr:hypothetical protein [Nitrospira sp. KM1]BCA54908.1 hypothetical protein W02_20480 [Nitrospira sp. KM1]